MSKFRVSKNSWVRRVFGRQAAWCPCLDFRFSWCRIHSEMVGLCPWCRILMHLMPWWLSAVPNQPTWFCGFPSNSMAKDSSWFKHQGVTPKINEAAKLSFRQSRKRLHFWVASESAQAERFLKKTKKQCQKRSQMGSTRFLDSTAFIMPQLTNPILMIISYLFQLDPSFLNHDKPSQIFDSAENDKWEQTS